MHKVERSLVSLDPIEMKQLQQPLSSATHATLPSIDLGVVEEAGARHPAAR